MKVVELSDTDIQNVLALMDMAVKAGGLQAAQAALPLAAKIQNAPDKPEDPED